MVHPGGRPRTVSLSPDDMEKLGEEMCEWVIKNNPIHLSKWYSIEKMYTDKQWDAMQQVPEFLPYYERALKLVGYKYLEKGSEIEPALKQRWQRVYFKDLKRQEDEDAKFTIELSSQTVQQGSPEENAKLDQILDAMAARQSSRKTDTSTNNTESKS